MNLLLVNDVAIEADTMAKEIDWIKYGIEKVFAAYNAIQAKKIIREENIDILLSDIEMPGENGLELIEWLRNENIDIDCILLTCHADFSYAQKALSLGCFEYLMLPAKYEDIGKSVAKACTRRQKHQEEVKLQTYEKTWLKSQAESLEAVSDFGHNSPSELVDKCTIYIEEHLDDTALSVTGIAETFYVNAVHLNRIFKKEKGINISQWIIQERMNLAMNLLKTTDFSAQDIALKVGYDNYPYFSTVFKKTFEISPSQIKDQ